jgi:myo-inositol-1(or 4)-monophosphatase
MVAAARAARRSLLRHLAMRDELVMSTKERGDFVSDADLIAEGRIAAILRAGYPNYGFLMEESGLPRGQMGDCRWIVDPLDGTTNFLRGVPYFAVSIALQERGRIVAGVVFDPLRREMFAAKRGAGAFLNGQRLRVFGPPRNLSSRHSHRRAAVSRWTGFLSAAARCDEDGSWRNPKA